MRLQPDSIDKYPAFFNLLIMRYGPDRITEVDTSAVEETGHIRILLDGKWQWTRIDLERLYTLEDELQIKDKTPRLRASSS
jgi:hypothetical protein